jgi:predicted ATPase
MSQKYKNLIEHSFTIKAKGVMKVIVLYIGMLFVLTACSINESRNVSLIPFTGKSHAVLNTAENPTIEKILAKVEPLNHKNGQKRYIITGGPGAGKTSIVNALTKSGYLCMPEAATEIIEFGLKNGIEKPWREDDYHINMYKLIMKRQVEAQNTNEPIVFFDRGHLDGLSYILLQKRKIYQYVVDCAQSILDARFFEKRVFFIDSLGFVVPGPARDEDLEESLQKAACLERNYCALGYEIIHIPEGTVEQRVQMIIDYIQQWENEDNFEFLKQFAQ